MQDHNVIEHEKPIMSKGWHNIYKSNTKQRHSFNAVRPWIYHNAFTTTMVAYTNAVIIVHW